MTTAAQYYAVECKQSTVKGKESRDEVIKKFNLKTITAEEERQKIIRPFITRNGMPHKIIEGVLIPLKKITP